MNASKAATIGVALALAPSNSVRLGAYFVHFHPDASDVTGPGTVPGLNLEVKDLTTLYFAYIRRLSPDFDFELAFGYPPLTKTVAKGPAYVGSVPYNGEVIGTARWISPTALFEYKFLDESARLRPYVGLGVNYTRFYSRQSTAAGDAVSGGPTSISLPASVGVAGTVGLSYSITEHWNLHASYSIADVHSQLTTTTAGVERTAHISFWPAALVISAGFTF